jgi:hypothetical protein
MEACASSHHWSRELQALGHTVRINRPNMAAPTNAAPKADLGGLSLIWVNSERLPFVYEHTQGLRAAVARSNTSARCQQDDGLSNHFLLLGLLSLAIQ